LKRLLKNIKQINKYDISKLGDNVLVRKSTSPFRSIMKVIGW